MAYYAIGIGGTGAKCLESLIHLAAAGMMPDGELHVLFVDPDTANGSLARARQTLTCYVACKNNIQLGKTPFLKTEIVPAEPNFWTPFEDEPLPSLEKFFDYNILDSSKDSTHVAAARLFEVLYSEQERTTPLHQGFRGHPSIGSAVMAKTVNLRQNEPWHTFIQQIDHDQNAKVFLAGSIFGGTGAAGLPTIARLVKNELKDIGGENVKLGGALVLPYFYFTFPQNDEELDAELKAESKHFLMNTQAALKYYYLWNETGIYDAVYLFGDEPRTEVDSCVGGAEQQNAPHFIELYAALAAIHFFGFEFEGNGASQYFLRARRQKDKLQWEDLPDSNDGNTIRSQIGTLARFAFAYLSVYQPKLKEIDKDRRKSYSAPWFIDFFKRRNQIRINDDLTQKSLRSVEEYCHAFLLWLANIQATCGDTEAMDLVRYTAYTERNEQNRLVLKPVNNFESEYFGSLIQTQNKAGPNTLNELWKLMSDGSTEAHDAGGIGKFLRILYDKVESAS